LLLGFLVICRRGFKALIIFSEEICWKWFRSN